MESWQDRLTSNKQRLSHLYKSGELSDVTVIVGRGGETKKSFKLHKLILSMQSDVFSTMFYGSLPEKDHVEVIDINPAIFEIVVKYVYNGTFLVRSMEEAMGTYCAADKYNIVHLRSLCASFITNSASPENIPILFRMPNILETLKIKSKCDQILSEQTSAILKSDNFVKSPLCLVKTVLQLSHLSIEREAEIFQCVLKWAKAAKNTTRPSATLRTIMDPFLPHIRFLAMNVEEFLSGPARSGILADFEKASILENLAEPNCRELPSWCNKNTSRISFKSLKILQNHTCRFWKEEPWAMRYHCGQNFNNDYVIDITMTKGTLEFRGVSFYINTSGTGEPKASLSVRGTGFLGDHRGAPSSCFKGMPNQCTSSYDPNMKLMRCMLSKPFRMDCHGFHFSVSVSLQDCNFEYCSSAFADGTIISNECFEFRLHCRSAIRKGHFHEIFYN